MRRIATTVAIVAAGVLVVGCARNAKPGGSDGNGVIMRPVKPPPAVPPRVMTPVDFDLRQRAQSELTRSFASSDPVLRANTVEATQRGLGPLASDRISLALGDRDPLVRFAAAMAAGSAKLNELQPKLLGMLEDPDPSVQVGVRYALHQTGEHRYSHDLETLATNKDPHVRANVVVALGLIGDPSALKILTVMEHDVDPAVRLQAIESEYRLGEEHALEKLVTGTISKYADDQILCLMALSGRKDQRVSRVLEGKLTDDYPEVSLAAARSLGVLGSDAGMGVALKFATSNEARQRGMAALALGEIGRSDAQPQLARLLTDRDPNVRIAAASAILQLKPM